VSLARSLTAIESQWQAFTASFAGPTATVVGQVRPLITELLPDVRKLAMAGETGISALLSAAGAAGTGGLGRFVTMLATNAPAAIMRLGIAIGHIVSGIGGILRAFMPVQSHMMSGLDSITGKFAKWGQTLSSHSGFQSLMSMFKSETPLAVSALKQLGALIKTVVSNMAGMSTFSNSKMLLQGLNLLLPALNKLARVPGLVSLILYFKLASDAGGKLKAAIAGVSDGVAGLKTATSAAGNLRKGMSDAGAAASDATGVWGTFGGKISGAVTAVRGWSAGSKIAAAATRVWTGVQAALDVVMDANPIGIIIIAVAALVAVIVVLTVKFQFMRNFWKAAWKDIQMVAVAAFHVLVDAAKLWVKQWVVGFDLARDAVKIAFLLITGYIRVNVDVIKAVLSWFGRLGSLFRGWWDDAARAVSDGQNRIVGFVRALPGRILSGLAGLGSMLWNAGAHAIDELISGLSSGIGKIGSVMSGVASKIAGFIGLSPAKEGPLSGGGAPRIRGMHIPQDVAAGMLSGLPSVGSAAARMAGMAALPYAVPGTGARGGTGAPGGTLTVQLEWAGGNDSEIITALAHAIRAKGGSPGVLTQKVVFA
jgi:hypothetical protein